MVLSRCLASCIFVCTLFCIGSSQTIDLFVTTYHGDLGLLLPLFRSFEIFFPKALLGAFYVIIEKGVIEDEAIGLLMPPYVTVIHEELIDIPSDLRTPHRNAPASHLFKSEASNFFVDKYGTSEFIGILDSDVIFRTGNIERLLFKNGKPIIFCTQHRDMAMEGVRQLGPEFDVLDPFSCMENFPFVLRRDTLPKLRAFLMQRLNADDEATAFSTLFGTSTHSLYVGNFALMGSYAYVFERSRYHFVIGGGGPLSTCPEIRACMHVFYGSPNWRSHQDAKVHPEYFDTARRAMSRGVCRMQCNSTRACEQILAEDPYDEELLSLESTHEMMFGRLDSLYKPECLKYIIQKLKRHRKELKNRACAPSSP